MLTRADHITADSPANSLTEMQVEIIPLNQSERIRKEWLALAASAIEPNPFYTPDYLKALSSHIIPNKDHWLVLIWQDETRKNLSGLFPVTRMGVKDGFPLSVTGFTFHSLIGICTPLIAPQNPGETWAEFLKAMNNHPHLPATIHIPEFYRNGPAGKALETLEEKGRIIRQPVSAFERVAARPSISISMEDYTKRWSRKKARNIRTREKKLNALGKVEYQLLTQSDAEFGPAFDAVLALELAGWKGNKGTALASSPETMAFAKEAFHSTTNAPLTHMSLLRLDGKIIAGQINLVAGDHIFFIKSAYDETLSHCSPGILLYKWSLQEMLDHGRYRELDSCADANHPLKELWLELNTVEEVFLAAANSTNCTRLQKLLFWRRTVLSLKNYLKNGLKKLLKKG